MTPLCQKVGTSELEYPGPVNADDLVTLYFRTTLVLANSSGTPFHIQPVDESDSPSADPTPLLSPYRQAFILTAENPESLGHYTANQNAEATASLRRLLSGSGYSYRDCPGYAWDSDHVEPGFAVLASDQRASEVQGFTIGLAEKFRQNAIFRLDANGLGILGALRQDLGGTRPVVITPA